MKINKLEIENVKRVRAVAIEPSANGLTVIGGKNAQGKTSVLDAIAWALGGDRYRPENAARQGSIVPPVLRVELSNGIIVERKGKNSALTVTDPKGNRAGQQLLDAFVEKLALDLPKFMQANNKEKADTLLQIIGVKDELERLRLQEQKLYNQRHAIGVVADQKEKFAREMPSYPDAPGEPVSASELILRQQEILARNGENERKRRQAERYNRELEEAKRGAEAARARLEAELAKLKEAEENASIANRDALDLRDESTAELEQSIRDVESINIKVRANLDKAKAVSDAEEYRRQYDALSDEIDKTRGDIMALLNGAALPLPELSVNEAGELTYKGFTWGDMSSAEQLQVATAIIRKLNPECEFVLIDRLEAMDIDTMRHFGQWLAGEGLQAICTRVSTGEECSIIISDGLVQETSEQAPTWKAGEF